MTAPDPYTAVTISCANCAQVFHTGALPTAKTKSLAYLKATQKTINTSHICTPERNQNHERAA